MEGRNDGARGAAESSGALSCRGLFIQKKRKKLTSFRFSKQNKKNSYQVTGVQLTSELINFAPVGVSVTGVGTTIAPQGVAINPSVILIQPNA